MFLFDFKGFGFSKLIIFLFFLVVLLITSINQLLFKLTNHKSPTLYYSGAIFVVLFLLGQCLHIWANEYNRHSVTAYTPYFPYYSPTTSASMMHILKNKYPKHFPATDHVAAHRFQSSKDLSTQLKYPKKNILLSDHLSSKPNIIFIVFESWRADSLTTSITPQIAQFSKQSHYFKNHLSNGTVTPSGLFSLMTGLYPNYWRHLKSTPNKNPSLFTKTLSDHDYDLAVYTSSNLNRFQLRSIIFPNVHQKNYHEYVDHSTHMNDKELTSDVVKSLHKSTQKPWFKFIFLSSSHHSYHYPDQHQKFFPTPKQAEAYIFNPQIDNKPFLNDYHNSLHYLDALFHRIVTKLKEQDLFNDTLIVLTSDHAEEFNDNKIGHWGHGSNFTLAQTAVPLLIKLPQQKKGITHNKRTYHVDIPTTILQDTLGVLNPIEDYSSGMNLFDKTPSRFSVLKSYNFTAYVIDNNIYQTNPHAHSYDISDINKRNTNFQYTLLRQITNKANAFLQ